MFILTNRPSKRFRTYESVVLDILSKHQSYVQSGNVWKPEILSMCVRLLSAKYQWYGTMYRIVTKTPAPNVQFWQDEHGYWRHSTDAVAAATKPITSPFQKAFKIKER